MTLTYSLLDVFAESPFQGTQIPVVIANDQTLSNQSKTSIAGEFHQTETVFIEAAKNEKEISVYNEKGQTLFGAHTILASSFAAHELGLTKDEGAFASFQLMQNQQIINSYIDKSDRAAGSIQFARTLSPTIDRYTPEIKYIAEALSLDEKHISYSKFRPMVVSVDRPILVVPFTKADHVLNARLNTSGWGNLQAEVYTEELFLFAPGTITGASEFHGRLFHPDLARDFYPPIGGVMPEFIAYLAEQGETAEGTHTFTIDRGSRETRKSVVHVEFDKRIGKETKCRIGGNVIKMGTGSLLFS